MSFSQNLKIQSQLDKKLRIQNMVRTIQSTTFQLIDYLDKLYRDNQINYSLEMFYATLIRIFLPLEIMVQYNIDGVNLFNESIEKFENKYKGKDKYKGVKIKEEISSDFGIGYKNSNVIQNFIKLPNEIQRPNHILPEVNMKGSTNMNTQFQIPKANPMRNNYGQSYKRKYSLNKYSKHPRQRALKKSIEPLLCDWIKSQVAKGRIIYKQDIGSKAKQYSQSEAFTGSIGWVDKFLRRNPEAKNLVTRRTTFIPNFNHMKYQLSSNYSHENPSSEINENSMKQLENENEWNDQFQDQISEQEQNQNEEMGNRDSQHSQGSAEIKYSGP